MIAFYFLTNNSEGPSGKTPLFLTAFCLVFYYGSAGFGNGLIYGFIHGNLNPSATIVHWLAVAALAYFLFHTIQFVRLREGANGHSKWTQWVLCIAVLAFLTIECRLVYLSVFASSNNLQAYNTNYAKAGLTITWALFSFTLIWLGLRFKNRDLRIIALSIFTIALLKLFLFDIRNIAEGGKIAAFIMLGGLLLVISFMYQRLKKIIINNEEKKD